MDVLRFINILSKRTLFLVIFLVSVAAYPCQCFLAEEKSITELVKDEAVMSDAIFVGKVKSIENIYDDRSGEHRVTFIVQKSWKLVKHEEIIVWTGLGRGDCGFPFIKGEMFLVYAVGSAKKLETTICTRTRNLRNAWPDIRVLGKPIWSTPMEGRIDN